MDMNTQNLQPVIKPFKPCEHNDKALYIKGKPVLRGFAGSQHDKHLDALPGTHVFLDASYLPRMLYSNKGYPSSWKKDVIFYPIDDQGVPEDMDEFKYLIQLLIGRLRRGKQVNISCIGGHGRTGLLLAILYGLQTKSTTPIEDIRQEYCSKAVESYKQKQFIHAFLKLPEPVRDPIRVMPKQLTSDLPVSVGSMWASLELEDQFDCRNAGCQNFVEHRLDDFCLVCMQDPAIRQIQDQWDAAFFKETK